MKRKTTSDGEKWTIIFGLTPEQQAVVVFLNFPVTKKRLKEFQSILWDKTKIVETTHGIGVMTTTNNPQAHLDFLLDTGEFFNTGRGIQPYAKSGKRGIPEIFVHHAESILPLCEAHV